MPATHLSLQVSQASEEKRGSFDLGKRPSKFKSVKTKLTFILTHF